MMDIIIYYVVYTCTVSFRPGDGTLSMQLVGKDFHVKFFRHKKQQIYRWKGKEKEKFVSLHAFSIRFYIHITS